ncbi:MAG TPA: SMC-Scp complex subunit ScpB [Lacipirellulaceae bacterium]|nr:SMC-Scp complex subunit ScpB [Lacipirellulaceae bacterium]
MAEVPAKPLSPPTESPSAAGRFSLERLSSAFARLMGAPAPRGAKVQRPQIDLQADDDLVDPTADAAPVTPRMIVEGMLFVGTADGRPLSSAEMAAHIRNMKASEVDDVIGELSAAYLADGAAYEIVSSPAGHRLQLRRELAPVRERCRGQQRTAKLTPAALEVLSIVAYRQPVSGDDVNKLRGSQSYAVLAQLVRRQLVRVERKPGSPRTPHYHTTERFNRLFNVRSPADLPRSDDLADA